MPVVHTDDDASLYYWTLGTGPLTLVLLHGWAGAGSGHSWRHVLPHLDSSRMRMLVPDLRGHGGSNVGTQGFSATRIAQDIFQLASHAEAEQLVTIAFSMSGKWAQAMACMRPDAIAGQILVAPAPLNALHLPSTLPQEWIENTRDRRRFGDFIQSFTKDPVAPDILDEYYHDASTTPEQSLLETLRICSEEEISAGSGTHGTPTMVCGGSADGMFTSDFLREHVVEKFAGSSFELLDCGHEIPIERPRELASLITGFCSERLP